jgi:hypothetical protein
MRTLAIRSVILLALPALAVAKGPSSTSISGPGLDGSLAIRGDGELTDNRLGTLAMASGGVPPPR